VVGVNSSQGLEGERDHTEYMVLALPLRNSAPMGSIAMLVEQKEPLVLFCPLCKGGVGGIFPESVPAESRKPFSHVTPDWAGRTPLLTIPPLEHEGASLYNPPL